MHNIEEKNCTSLLEGALGLPLREKNLGPLQSKLQQQGKVVLETDLQHDACGAGGPLADLPKADHKMAEMLKAAIDKGGSEAKATWEISSGRRSRRAVQRGRNTKGVSRAQRALPLD